MHVRSLGVSRCGATATAAMLDEYRRREKAEASGAGLEKAASSSLGSGGY
jgi:deoxyribose-phosphate aldolase